MNKIDGYSVYQQTSYNSIKKNKTEEANSNNKAGKTDKANKTEKLEAKVELSKEAKALLEELRKKYGNMDFMVADYDSEEEASDILSRGTKEYSVLIESEMLEKMAADEEYKAKQLGILEEATGNLKEMSQQLGDKAGDVKRLGVSVGADGKVTYFAELEKMSEKQRARIEKSKADKKETEKAAEKKAEKQEQKEKANNAKNIEKDVMSYSGKHRTTLLKSDTTEGLLELISNLNWNEVKEEQLETTGTKFDFTI